MDDNYAQLANRVAELEKWKAERTAQQIAFPLDIQSQTILQKYFLSLVGNIWYTSAGGNLFKNILVKQDDRVNVLSAYTSLIQYTADPSTDVLTLGLDIVNLNQGSFSNGQQVAVIGGGDLAPGGDPPAPLTTSTLYYVVNAASGGTKIKLSLTFGGAAIDITNTGTGPQYIYFVT